MARKVMGTGLLTSHRLHRRTYGESYHQQIVWESGNENDRLWHQARERTQQRVPMLLQFWMCRVEDDTVIALGLQGYCMKFLCLTCRSTLEPIKASHTPWSGSLCQTISICYKIWLLYASDLPNFMSIARTYDEQRILLLYTLSYIHTQRRRLTISWTQRTDRA